MQYAYAPHDATAKRFWSYAMSGNRTLDDRVDYRQATAVELRRLRRVAPSQARIMTRWMHWVGNYPTRWRREDGRWSDVTYAEFNSAE
jgi:hypothetical protein